MVGYPLRVFEPNLAPGLLPLLGLRPRIKASRVQVQDSKKVNIA